MSSMKKGRKGKQVNKGDVPGEWMVKGLSTPLPGPPSNEQTATIDDSLENPSSFSLAEFIQIDRGIERTARREKKEKVGGKVNKVSIQESISGQGQSLSVPNEGKELDVNEWVQVAAPGSAADSDRHEVLSDIEQFVKNNLEVENNKGPSGSKEEDYKQRDIASIVKKMKTLSLSISEPELSESQIEMSDQEQEDEVLALKAIYGDDMLVFEREDGSPRAFKISIHVEIPDNIDITINLPPFSNGHEPSGSMSRSSLRDNTLAGNTYTFRVQHLPPIVLTCVLPKSYPCYMPPQFTILAYWLDSGNICKLCNALDNIWSEDQGQVVLYKWAEWLRSSSLPALGFNHEVLLDPYGMQTKADGRAISGCSSPNVDIPRLMQYNDEKNNEVFCSTFYMCNICFTEYPGTEFVRLQCQHFFCWKCMESYSHVLVRDGTVNKLNCPDPKCGASIPPGLLKRLLGDETFERWESLLLQKTLDSMTDVVYCPRCEAVCLEDEDNHAQCPKCFYSFCSLCRDRRHVGQTCMTPEMRLRILQERQSSSQLGSEQRKREQELINELLSVKQILRDAKQCPSCKMAISKTEGCNKMICYNCGQYFCYRCNEAISGYDHFSGGSCILFEQEEIQNWERAMNDRQLQGLAQVELWPQLGRPCPNCGQMNVKQGNNNHIFCWSCQNHFCALCHKVVRRSSEHYGPRGCKQHTAD